MPKLDKNHVVNVAKNLKLLDDTSQIEVFANLVNSRFRFDKEGNLTELIEIVNSLHSVLSSIQIRAEIFSNPLAHDINIVATALLYLLKHGEWTTANISSLLRNKDLVSLPRALKFLKALSKYNTVNEEMEIKNLIEFYMENSENSYRGYLLNLVEVEKKSLKSTVQRKISTLENTPETSSNVCANIRNVDENMRALDFYYACRNIAEGTPDLNPNSETIQAIKGQEGIALILKQTSFAVNKDANGQIVGEEFLKDYDASRKMVDENKVGMTSVLAAKFFGGIITVIGSLIKTSLTAATFGFATCCFHQFGAVSNSFEAAFVFRHGWRIWQYGNKLSARADVASSFTKSATKALEALREMHPGEKIRIGCDEKTNSITPNQGSTRSIPSAPFWKNTNGRGREWNIPAPAYANLS
jgi:hypothetical protein